MVDDFQNEKFIIFPKISFGPFPFRKVSLKHHIAKEKLLKIEKLTTFL